MLLRKSLRATRNVARGAAWAATRLLGAQRPPNGFTIQVKTHGGQCLSLDVVRPLAQKGFCYRRVDCCAAVSAQICLVSPPSQGNWHPVSPLLIGARQASLEPAHSTVSSRSLCCIGSQV